MKNHSIQTLAVVATGIGAALFVVIGLVVNIPTMVPNTSIQLQYAVQSLLAVIFGPVSGFLIGFIGHALKDSLQYGPWWTWILSSGLFGFIVGLLQKRLRVREGILTTHDILVFNGVQIVANLILWGVLAPILDIQLYSEASNKVFAQGMMTVVANSVTVGVAGTLLLMVYAKTQVQANSLAKDDD